MDAGKTIIAMERTPSRMQFLSEDMIPDTGVAVITEICEPLFCLSYPKDILERAITAFPNGPISLRRVP